LKVPELGQQDVNSEGGQKEQAGHKKAYAIKIMNAPAFIFKFVYTDKSHCVISLFRQQISSAPAVTKIGSFRCKISVILLFFVIYELKA
jgi:hypothetical protein